jgi:hypothetical protein
MSKAKRNELSLLLRRLADYVDNRSDEELMPLIEMAASLKPERAPRKKNAGSSKQPVDLAHFKNLIAQLEGLRSRQAGEALLLEQNFRRSDLEKLARILQLPVQRDDDLERLRAKIVENLIGSRLRSDAIQGGLRSPR